MNCIVQDKRSLLCHQRGGFLTRDPSKSDSRDSCFSLETYLQHLANCYPPPLETISLPLNTLRSYPTNYTRIKHEIKSQSCLCLKVLIKILVLMNYPVSHFTTFFEYLVLWFEGLPLYNLQLLGQVNMCELFFPQTRSLTFSEAPSPVSLLSPNLKIALFSFTPSVSLKVKSNKHNLSLIHDGFYKLMS